MKGWTAVSETKAIDLLRELADHELGAVIYTDIARDGMLNGPEGVRGGSSTVRFSRYCPAASRGWRICKRSARSALVWKAQLSAKLCMTAS